MRRLVTLALPLVLAAATVGGVPLRFSIEVGVPSAYDGAWRGTTYAQPTQFTPAVSFSAAR